MMIHRALAVCVGNEGDMADCGAWLKQIDNQLAAVYAAKTGRKLETMKKYMVGNVDGTTFDAQTALDVRLIDGILPVRGDKPAARNVADDERAAFAEQVRIKLANQRAAARVRVLEVAE
jgi:ATP-dependent protease ClpP protease subunit